MLYQSHWLAFVTPVVEHWLEREIAQWVHSMKDRSDNPSHHGRLPSNVNVVNVQSADKATAVQLGEGNAQ